jgi:hypothetical protein
MGRTMNSLIPGFRPSRGSGNPNIQIRGSRLRQGRRKHRNLTRSLTGLFLTCAFGTVSAAPVIPLYHATYSVGRNDLRIGNAQFSLTKSKNGIYTYTSVTQASGLAALFFSDVITEISHFTVTDGRLQPLLYSYTHTGNDHDQSQSIRFDWNRNIAYIADGNNHHAVPIKKGTYDRALAQLALSVDMEAGHLQETYHVLDHGKLHGYPMKHAGKAQLKTPAGTYDTVKIARADTQKGRVTTFWLAPKLEYLPVQMQQTEPGKATISLVLMDIKFDTPNSK